MYDNFFKVTNLVSVVIMLVCICSSFTGVTQDKSKIDSLSNNLSKADHDKERLPLLVSLSLEYYDVDNRLSFKYADEAYQIALHYGDSLNLVKSGRLKGQLLRRLDEIDESIKFLREVQPIAERNKFQDELKKILNGLALSFTLKANYDEALKYNFKSLLIREKEGKKEEISITLNNIGLVYFKLKNYDNAIKYYEKSLRLKKEANDKFDLDRLLINLGLCYNQTKNFEKARHYIYEGFSICDQNCNVQIKIEGHFGLGVSYYGEQDFEKSTTHFFKSYEIAKVEGSKRFQLENLIYLARISIKKKDNINATLYLTEAESLAFRTHYNLLSIEIYKEFSNVYNQTMDFEKAAFYQGKYIRLKDSIYSEALIKNIAKVQNDFEERENKAIIATNEEVILRQRNLNVAIAVIAVLCILLVFVLYHSNRVKKRVNQALSDAKEFIERKNKELDKKVEEKTLDLEVANESLVKVNEELDNFIYKTSHDIRGPLASLKGICNVALMDVKDVVAIDYLQKLDLTAEHLNSILTRLLIINQINNSSMKSEAVDFNAIVNEIIRLEVKKGMPSRIAVVKEIQEGIKYFADREFVRIIFENLINNAVKFHNSSDRVDPFVKIQVEQHGEEIHLHVVDNGIGINEIKPDKLFQMFSRASERSSTGGIGLYITKTAAEKLGGKVGIRKTTEGYTEFFIRFPLVPPRMI